MEKILLVDDEPNVLDGLQRQLRKHYEVHTAGGGEAGLATLAEEGPFAVVVSDMKMPQMDGARFLTHVRERDPDTVRMILSGQAELESTIAAVNNGAIFRFLTKPCDTESLRAALDDGIKQYRLVMAERELLENTLRGAVQLLTDTLAMVNPTAFSRSGRIQRFMDGLMAKLEVSPGWELRLAGMLSLLGCISVPEDTLQRIFAGQPLQPGDQEAFDAHPELAQQMLGRIPRLEVVADIVGSQATPVDHAQLPDHVQEWDVRTLGHQVLTAASRLDARLSRGEKRADAVAAIRASGALHPRTLAALANLRVESDGAVVSVKVSELRPGMVLEEDIRTRDGNLLLAKDYEITEAIILRLGGYASRGVVHEPLRVRDSSAVAAADEAEAVVPRIA